MYIKPDHTVWTGRKDSETDHTSFRIHQIVQPVEKDQFMPNDAKTVFSLIGFECDEGVKRNKGRVGAAQAPAAIKRTLANLPCHFTHKTDVIDVGSVRCMDHQLEEAQTELGEVVHHLLQSKSTPIIVGGGHETVYGHYLGVRRYLGPTASLGLINIDAHFDMRPYDEGPSSGTMFRQILDQDKHCHYLCVGIQQHGNTPFLFNEAEKYGCRYISEHELQPEQLAKSLDVIDQFIETHDRIMLTLCTDVICASAAPGVSAPAPFGLDPKTVRTLLQFVVSSPKTLSFDVSEVNPLVDENERTVRLASYLLADVMVHFNQRSN